MNKAEKTAELFYYSSNIPVFCFDADRNLRFSYPRTGYNMADLFSLFPDSDNTPAAICSDKNSLFWGKIETGEYTMIIGPVSTTVFSERIRHALMAEHFIGNEFEDELKQILSIIPRMSLYRFSAVTRILYQLNCNKHLSDEEVFLSDYLKKNDSISNEELQSKVLSSLYEDVDSGLEQYDISYEAEKELIKNIESGNIEALKQSFSSKDASSFGTLADTTMRSTKNLLMVVIAIASRTAIRNGVSVQIAYKLSDLYIQEIEQAGSFQALNSMVRDAVIDYSQRIQALKVPKGLSPMVYEGMRFIEQSISQPITVADVAEHADRSVSYFSAEFKKETGMNVSSYITKVKIEEAKRLLKYTDATLSYISYFLCFSSQSHFQKVFKNLVGVTPMAYRNNKQDKGK